MRPAGKHSGINLIRYIREHEAAVRAALASDPDLGSDRQDLLAWHLEKLRWLQHERLVHLLVTALFAVIFLIFYGFMLILGFNVQILVLLILMAIVLTAYIWHYYQLENSTQRWYRLADEIRARDKDKQMEQMP